MMWCVKAECGISLSISEQSFPSQKFNSCSPPPQLFKAVSLIHTSRHIGPVFHNHGIEYRRGPGHLQGHALEACRQRATWGGSWGCQDLGKATPPRGLSGQQWPCGTHVCPDDGEHLSRKVSILSCLFWFLSMAPGRPGFFLTRRPLCELRCRSAGGKTVGSLWITS